MLEQDLLPNLLPVHSESLFWLCPSMGRSENSLGVSPLRLECGRSVLTTKSPEHPQDEKRKVFYPWHPWVECIVQIDEVVEKASSSVARCSGVGVAVSRLLELPVWMFDRAACASMGMDTRLHVDVGALDALTRAEPDPRGRASWH